MTLVKVNQRPVDKAFTNFFGDIFGEFAGREWSKDGIASVPVNIHETTDAFHLELNAPGRSKEDFKLNVEQGLLTISYDKKAEEKVEGYKTVRKEFSSQSFKRSFNLDDAIDTNGVQAKYENGLLKIFLPKKEQSKEAAREISIN